jgi:hypothetical protein
MCQEANNPVRSCCRRTRPPHLAAELARVVHAAVERLRRGDVDATKNDESPARERPPVGFQPPA